MLESEVVGELFELRTIQGGPLSVLRTQGTPCRENMLSSFGITVLALVELIISTSGKRLNSSMTTSNSSPDGNGPAKSAAVVHGASGSFVMIRGSGFVEVQWGSKVDIYPFFVIFSTLWLCKKT